METDAGGGLPPEMAVAVTVGVSGVTSTGPPVSPARISATALANSTTEAIPVLRLDSFTFVRLPAGSVNVHRVS